jgi:hypothetical protein
MTTNGSGHRVDPARTRPALRSIEPTFGAGVLSPAVHEGLNRLGLGLDDVGVVNLVTRAAAMGPVGVDVVLATFYNVNPALVASVIPGSWEKASPDEILTAQREAFSPVLAAALGAPRSVRARRAGQPVPHGGRGGLHQHRGTGPVRRHGLAGLAR